MNSNNKRNISPIIFTGSTTMIGVCITVITLLIVTTKHTGTYIDEILASDTLFFIISAFISYLSLRWNNHRHLELIADIIFFIGMLLMVASGIFLVFKVF